MKFRKRSLVVGIQWMLSMTPAIASHAAVHGKIAQDNALIAPVAVVGTSGAVDGAGALVTGAGAATLTMTPGGPVPSITLDYGHEVGGLPMFEVSAVAGQPALQAEYGEARQYLQGSGDGSFPDGAEMSVSFVGNSGSASQSRVNTYRPTQPGIIVSRLVQGGERFQTIRLTTPGSITLTRAGLRPLPSAPGVSLGQGYFRCSDAALNDIWNLGAYTVDFDRIAAGSLPPMWTVTPQGLDVKDSAFSIYQAGTSWSSYTLNFDVQVVANETGWLVWANPMGGYRVVLAADNDTAGPPNTLRVTHTFTPGTVTQVPLPFDLQPGTWHHVRTEAGSALKVYIDDQLVLNALLQGMGSFGFAGYDGSEGLFRNLQVDGNTSFQASLTDPAVLDAFAAGTNRTTAIVDGAKRDRYIWSGDMAVAGPTIYYSSGAIDAVNGSLGLLSTYQRSDGMVSSDAPPQLAPAVASGDAMPGLYFYSLSYSAYVPIALYDYFLYTGDANFLSRQWPAVQREIAYLRSHANAQHLVVTDASNGMDWHPQDGTKLTGTVTAFNVLYYRALRDASLMAWALGDQSNGNAYDAEATLVKNAINGTLFDTATGLYDLSDQIHDVMAQDANALAIAYDVAPPEQRTSILARLAATLGTPNGTMAFTPGSPYSQVVSPFVSSFEVWARFEANDAAGALALIRNEWGHMRPGTPYYSGATWESMGMDGTPLPPASAHGAFPSLAHGWASGPTSALSKYVLGVRPLEPGYRSWLVQPQPGDLTWAQGRVPTPLGPIDVQWQNTPQGFVMTVVVPPGTVGTVGLPPGVTASSVSVNGQPARLEKLASLRGVPASRLGHAYLRNLSPGRYRITTGARL